MHPAYVANTYVVLYEKLTCMEAFALQTEACRHIYNFMKKIYNFDR